MKGHNPIPGMQPLSAKEQGKELQEGESMAWNLDSSSNQPPLFIYTSKHTYKTSPTMGINSLSVELSWNHARLTHVHDSLSVT